MILSLIFLCHWIDKLVINLIIVNAHAIWPQVREKQPHHWLADESTQMMLYRLRFSVNPKDFVKFVYRSQLAQTISFLFTIKVWCVRRYQSDNTV